MMRTPLITAGALLLAQVLVTGILAIVYGPGTTLRPEHLSLIVLQPEDVPRGEQVEFYGSDEDESFFGIRGSHTSIYDLANDSQSSSSLVQIDSTAAIHESRYDAVESFRLWDSLYSGRGNQEIFEGSGLAADQVELPDLGEHTSGYVIHCQSPSCGPSDSSTIVIMFQRANVFSLMLGEVANEQGALDETVLYAQRQDERIESVLNEEKND